MFVVIVELLILYDKYTLPILSTRRYLVRIESDQVFRLCLGLPYHSFQFTVILKMCLNAVWEGGCLFRLYSVMVEATYVQCATCNLCVL